MKRAIFCLACISAFCTITTVDLARADQLFYDNFEGGLGQWSTFQWMLVDSFSHSGDWCIQTTQKEKFLISKVMDFTAYDNIEFACFYYNFGYWGSVTFELHYWDYINSLWREWQGVSISTHDGDSEGWYYYSYQTGGAPEFRDQCKIVIESSKTTYVPALVLDDIALYGDYVGVEEIEDCQSSIFAFSQNSPNPVISETHIEYALPKTARVTLMIYDLTGRLVKTLVNEEIETGYHTVSWDGRDNSGKKVASGIYFYRMETDKFKATKKLTIIR
ncbi:T9SS type A sorting domain-containing protein [candidate division WOR-3 bacterium]|nr:T9SS type A sorting domain-containing protein [candidate division WOR-3 bacterium]